MRVFCVFSLFILVCFGGIFGCDRDGNEMECGGFLNSTLEPIMVEDSSGVLIERWHIYESVQLEYFLPPGGGVVQLVQDTGKVMGGHPDDLLQEINVAPNDGLVTIERNPQWFAENQEIKWFALEIQFPDGERQFLPFFWCAPDFSLIMFEAMHQEAFLRHGVSNPTPHIIGFDAYDYGLRILFERPQEIEYFPGVLYEVNVLNADDQQTSYIRHGSWSTKSDDRRMILSATLSEYVRYEVGDVSTVTVRPIWQTETGNIVGQWSNILLVPYKVWDDN